MKIIQRRIERQKEKKNNRKNLYNTKYPKEEKKYKEVVRRKQVYMVLMLLGADKSEKEKN